MAFSGNPRIVRKATGAAELVKVPYGEATGQSYKAGELIYTSSGQATVCTAGSGAAHVLGIAQKDAAGVAGTEVFVEPIYPEDDVEMVCSTTVTTAMPGIAYALAVASNVWTVNLSDTSTQDTVTVVRPVYSVGGALSTKAIVHFLPAICQSVTGA